MASSPDHATPWLVELATVQRNTGPHPGGAFYDEHAQMTYLRVSNSPAIADRRPPESKKADLETGEDQKGF
jgi:hypothetical protein